MKLLIPLIAYNSEILDKTTPAFIRKLVDEYQEGLSSVQLEFIDLLDQFSDNIESNFILRQILNEKVLPF